ncbi:hypothetical protein BC834DRAFT_1036260 [Gloeopeniophorella convolvens]|nr:hypothetical protein BC834DRAFT_1036260 [Gloeopeniophorella convolvens]
MSTPTPASADPPPATIKTGDPTRAHAECARAAEKELRLQVEIACVPACLYALHCVALLMRLTSLSLNNVDFTETVEDTDSLIFPDLISSLTKCREDLETPIKELSVWNCTIPADDAARLERLVPNFRWDGDENLPDSEEDEDSEIPYDGNLLGYGSLIQFDEQLGGGDNSTYISFSCRRARVTARTYGYELPRVRNRTFANSDYIDVNHSGKDNPATVCVVGNVPDIFDKHLSNYDEFLR